MVAALGFVEAGRAAEFCDEANEGVCEKAALVHVFNEGAEGLVGGAHHPPGADPVAAHAALGAGQIARAVGVNVIVMVPVEVAPARGFGGVRFADINGDKTHAGFDEFAPRQVTLAAVATAVAFPGGVGLTLEVEGPHGVGVGEQILGLVVKGFHRLRSGDAIGGQADVEVAQKFAPVAESALVDAGGEAEVGHLPLRVSEVFAGGFERGETRGQVAGASHGALLMVAGDHDVGRQIVAAAAGAVGDYAADVGHFHRPSRHFPGEDVLGAAGMVVHLDFVAHGAHYGEFVRHLGRFREQFGEVHPGDVGADGLVDAPVFGWGVRLWIPGVHVREAALFEDD